MRIDHYGEVHADISSLIEREHLMDVLGTGLPPEKYNFGGMSGGPMLTVVEHKGIRGWRLAGVLYDGPNPSADPAQSIDGRASGDGVGVIGNVHFYLENIYPNSLGKPLFGAASTDEAHH
jgi:hypothetical protein